MISLSTEEIVEHRVSLHIPLYDISQKVKEANEALKNDVTPLREAKQFRVKFCPNLVHYEPDVDNSSDTTCDDSTDGTDVSGGVLDRSNDSSSSYGLHSSLLRLKKKQEGVNVYCNVDAPQLITDTHTYNHGISWKSSVQPKEEIIASRLENQKPANSIGDSCSQIKLENFNNSDNEISLANFNEVLKDIEFNEKYKTDDESERHFVNDDMALHISKNEDTDITKINLEEKRQDVESSDNKWENVNNEDDKQLLKQEGTMNSPLSHFNCSPQGCVGILLINEQYNENCIIKRSDKLLSQKEIIDHHNQLAFTPSICDSKISDLHKSHQKYLMHYKWNNARLPTYNGLYSEYGLTAEMLDERKRKAETIRQNLWEKKKQEDEIKEQKRRDNDESFKEWLRKKEAERRKMAEGNKDFEYIYDRQEAENAFQLWLKRKSKELRLQKKLENTEREYERKLAQRRAREESQREFKRWLREKVKKSSPGKHKSNSFNNRRKSYKRHCMEKNIHMKNTCKIYLGH